MTENPSAIIGHILLSFVNNMELYQIDSETLLVGFSYIFHFSLSHPGRQWTDGGQRIQVLTSYPQDVSFFSSVHTFFFLTLHLYLSGFYCAPAAVSGR